MRDLYGTFDPIAAVPVGTAGPACVRIADVPVPAIMVAVLSDPGRRTP